MRRILLIIFFIMFIFPAFGKNYFIIGLEQGEGELIYPRKIIEGPYGNIYIYDQRDAFIKVYSSEGKYLRRIGGKGQGPGEIQRADAVSFGFTADKKLLFFTEFFRGHRWITFMELNGKFKKVLKLEMNKEYGILQAFSLKDGGFLAKVGFESVPEKKKDYFVYHEPIALVKIDSRGRICREIVKMNIMSRISKIGDGGDMGIPFTPIFEWVPLNDKSIVFTDGLSKNLRVYNHKGELIREIETPLSVPGKVTKKDLDKWKERRRETFRHRNTAWYKRFGNVIEKYKKSIYKYKPNISGMCVTPESNILLAGLWDSENERRKYFLIDRKGKTLIEFKTKVYGIRISNNFVFFKLMDEDENVLVCCMKRQGAEKEDLIKLAKQFK